MPYHLYQLINFCLRTSAYEDMRAFHAKTNNVFLFKGDPLKEHRSKISKTKRAAVRKIEHCDLPLVLHEGGRVDLSAHVSLENDFLRDKSAHIFEKKTYDTSNLFKLLHSAFGETKDKAGNILRPYPSAGALYPVQVIVAVRTSQLGNATHLVNGFYHYRPQLKAMDLLNQTSENEMIKVCFSEGDTSLQNFNFCLIYVVHAAKSFFKYSYRSYRLSLLEVGSMYQQASLVGKKLGLKNRVLSGFADYELAKIMGLNPCVFFPAIIQVFGTYENP